MSCFHMSYSDDILTVNKSVMVRLTASETCHLFQLAFSMFLIILSNFYRGPGFSVGLMCFFFYELFLTPTIALWQWCQTFHTSDYPCDHYTHAHASLANLSRLFSLLSHCRSTAGTHPLSPFSLFASHSCCRDTCLPIDLIYYHHISLNVFSQPLGCCPSARK